MNTAIFFGVLALAAAEAAAVSPADEIKYDTTRPLMKLTGELQDRYGYLVTYEDAPVPKEALVTEKSKIGPDYSYPAWKPVAFHVDARLPTASDDPVPQPAIVDAEGRVYGHTRPLGPAVIDPIIQEYNSSGNPGQFKVIYDGAYAHIVPAGVLEGGRLVPFEPILSTEIAVDMPEGTCWDLLNGLVDEVQQARKVGIMLWAVPVSSWDPDRCSISGHNLPARDVLLQLLGQIGKHGRTGSPAEDKLKLPEERYAWGLVYEPTSDAYSLWIDSVHNAEEERKPKVLPAPARPPSPGPSIEQLLMSPVPGATPVKKK